VQKVPRVSRSIGEHKNAWGEAAISLLWGKACFHPMKKTKRPRPEPSPPKPYECLYQLKIHLLDINPQVYRRFIVRGDTTVVKLHHIVQLVMGWDNWHLHYFGLNDSNVQY
jgi:hypothetical protein